MTKRLMSAVFLTLSIVGVAHGQAVNSWYPGATTLYHVKNCWYDLRSFNGGSARVGMSFTENPAVSFFFYFTPTDATQLQKASAIYASLLSAKAGGDNVYLFVSAIDSVNTAYWDFISVQLGPN